MRSKNTLLQYSSLTPLERQCYEGEVQPYRKTDYKPMMMNHVNGYRLCNIIVYNYFNNAMVDISLITH